MASQDRLTFLWTGANMLLAEAPVASRSMASRLALSTIRRDDGVDEMAPAARRFHCGSCGGLLTLGSTVRLRRRSRSMRRPRRARGPFPQNHVLRTCGQCASGNVSNGTRKVEDAAEEGWNAMRAGDGRKRTRRVSCANIQPQEDSKGRSRKKRKSEKVDGSREKNARETPDANGQAHISGSLATSFLFKPLL